MVLGSKIAGAELKYLGANMVKLSNISEAWVWAAFGVLTLCIAVAAWYFGGGSLPETAA